MGWRGSDRGCWSVWGSQPGLLSHLQLLSMLHTPIHTGVCTCIIHNVTHSHTHMHTADDNQMTRQQHTTACHFCLHSVTRLLITCKLMSRCPQVTKLTTKSLRLLLFLIKLEAIQYWLLFCIAYTSVQPKRRFYSSKNTNSRTSTSHHTVQSDIQYFWS